jgi:NAD(P)-dependent dehydrogenase (short-subunit alcohol dehydrogenase family)
MLLNELKEMNEIFSIQGKIAVITGASGVLGGSLAESFVKAGATVVALGRNQEKLDARVKELTDSGGNAFAVEANVMDVGSLEAAANKIVEKYGKIDILLNIAGGNIPAATLSPDQSFLDMNIEGWNQVTDLNINGTVYPSYVFGKVMAQQGSGSIVNISSMAAYSAITRVAGYSAAKAAITNFTQWLASDLALKYGDTIRVNAIAPGFFIGDQNRNILLNPDGSLTERSIKVIAKTPMGRFGDAEELNGAVQFLCSDAASFITGALLPVDGGFSAFSGV